MLPIGGSACNGDVDAASLDALTAELANTKSERDELAADNTVLVTTNERLTSDLQRTKDLLSLATFNLNKVGTELTITTTSLTKVRTDYDSVHAEMVRVKEQLRTVTEDLKWAKVRIEFLESLPQLKGILNQEGKIVTPPATKPMPVNTQPAAKITPPTKPTASSTKPTAPVTKPSTATNSKPACNNGVGNGADGCTPGKAPFANDENGATKGNPGAKNGVDKQRKLTLPSSSTTKVSAKK